MFRYDIMNNHSRYSFYREKYLIAKFNYLQISHGGGKTNYISPYRRLVHENKDDILFDSLDKAVNDENFDKSGIEGISVSKIENYKGKNIAASNLINKLTIFLRDKINGRIEATFEDYVNNKYSDDIYNKIREVIEENNNIQEIIEFGRNAENEREKNIIISKAKKNIEEKLTEYLKNDGDMKTLINFLFKFKPKSQDEINEENILEQTDLQRVLNQIFQVMSLYNETGDLENTKQKYEEYLSLDLTKKKFNNFEELTKIVKTGRDYEKLYEDDKMTLYKVLTGEGSCKLGSGTQWCTTMGSEGVSQYYSDGKKYDLHIIIPKPEYKLRELEKYQFICRCRKREIAPGKPEREIRNERDHIVPFDIIWRRFPGISNVKDLPQQISCCFKNNEDDKERENLHLTYNATMKDIDKIEEKFGKDYMGIDNIVSYELIKYIINNYYEEHNINPILAMKGLVLSDFSKDDETEVIEILKLLKINELPYQARKDNREEFKYILDALEIYDRKSLRDKITNLIIGKEI